VEVKVELGGYEGEEPPVVQRLVFTLDIVGVHLAQREHELRQIVKRSSRFLRCSTWRKIHEKISPFFLRTTIFPVNIAKYFRKCSE
jgi:hypothetical protein